MGPQRTQLDLRIVHPAADLSPVCAKLGLQPKIIWTQGEARITPKGRNIGGIRDNSYCSINLDFSHFRLIPKIEAAIALLEPHKAVLRELSDTGGRIVFAIGWFLDEDTGESFEWNVLNALADLRIRLEFYVYGADRDRWRVRANELKRSLTSLVQSLSATLDRKTREILDEFIDDREYGGALEWLYRVIRDHSIELSSEQRQEIQRIAELLFINLEDIK